VEKPKDYYGLLEIPRDASPDKIKRAYRRLARKWHPDAEGGSAEQFRALKDAYETLVDADARARYDRTLEQGKTGDRVWAAWAGAAHGEILLSPAEAAAGGSVPLEVPVRSACRTCQGSGGTQWFCASCDGEGTVERRVPVVIYLPPGVRDGALFQVHASHESPTSVLLVVHVVR
jgi:DnaJ-class molecular chaperone